VLAGVIQFGFIRPYDWLPREQELLTAAAERCIRAIEKARMMENLAYQQTQIRRLAERMMHVEEAERRRISRELHDQTGQDLLCIRLQMEMIEQEMPEETAEWRNRLTGVRDLTEKTILEIRRLIAALSPAVLEQLGLAPAIRQLITRFRNRHNAKVRFHAGRLGLLPKNLEVIVYRLVQECLNNIVKHSQCSNVNISVHSADGILRLDVEDDGVGFQVEEALMKRDSFGLAGVRERVALLGGVCSIESAQAKNSRGKPDIKSIRAKELRGNRVLSFPTGTKICIELPISAVQDTRKLSIWGAQDPEREDSPLAVS
jgi:signal transduction histidine kinase